MRPRTPLIAALLLIAALPARPAGATMILPMALDELTDAAERVALVRVESQAARWTSDHKAIYTEVTLRVLQPVKGGGAAGEVVVMRREGGVVGEVGMRVSGAAGFVTGEEVLVFLERRGPALWTVGMAMGRMPVAMVDGRKVVIRQTAGLGFLKAPAPEPAVRDLDEVMARVRDRAARRAP